MAILCIGEMLIDFIGEGFGTIDKVNHLKRKLEVVLPMWQPLPLN